jgi:hypothetical protein
MKWAGEARIKCRCDVEMEVDLRPTPARISYVVFADADGVDVAFR